MATIDPPNLGARFLANVSTIVLVVLALIAVNSSFSIVQPGNVGVVFNRWTGSLRTVGQGLVWRIPFITDVQSYPVALRTYTMVARSGEGSSINDDSIDLPTKEGQHIRQDISVTYNTSQEQAADVFRVFRGADIEDIEATFIRRTSARKPISAFGFERTSEITTASFSRP